MEKQPSNAGEMKAQEYIARIKAGEPKESVIEGLSPSFITSIENGLKISDPETQNTQNASEEIPQEAESETIRKEADDPLLDSIPVQHRAFAESCASLGDEGEELFREIMQGPIYIDQEKNAEQKLRMDEMINSLRLYREKKMRSVLYKTKLHDTREGLGLKNSIEIDTASPVDSIDLKNNSEMHKVSGSIEGIFYNSSHGQDAFSVQEQGGITCLTVCDGISSRKGSGELSSKLAKKISQEGLSKPLSEIFDHEYLGNLVDNVSRESGKIEGGGGSTSVSVRIDKQRRTIEWSSIGDSPLFIIDTDQNGNVISWEIMNENSRVTNENYTNMDTLTEMGDPETQAVGIREDGTTNIPRVDKIKSGQIEYKKGRKLVLASDFLTKVMLYSPEAALAKKTYWENAGLDPDGAPYSEAKKSALSELWGNVAARNEEDFSDLWTKNPATGEMMINPLFAIGKTSAELKDVLDGWMTKNTSIEDDATVMSVDLDKYFN